VLLLVAENARLAARSARRGAEPLPQLLGQVAALCPSPPESARAALPAPRAAAARALGARRGERRVLTPLLVSTDSRAGEEGAIRSVDHAVVGGVVAVVVFAMLCLLIILGRYFARHKGKAKTGPGLLSRR